ncbi:penicillin-binding protein [Demequina aurantiaca]|uniref:penicillin-binding protein n=1 Tax=Demequina aurantiaca TaxID=676200 RepID=UPI003D3406FF
MGLFTSDRARQDGRVTVVQLLTGLLLFVAFSVMGGFLIAGLALPAVTVAGSAANGTSDMFQELPTELEFTALPQQSNIYDRTGKVLLATFYDQNRVVEPLEDISPWLQKAVVAVEDKRFWEHNGVDGEGVLSAAVKNVTTDSTPGASTLTQQLIKNTLLQNAISAGDEEAQKEATETSLTRKIREWSLALAYEDSLNASKGTTCTDSPEVDCGKEQVLEQYLNIAQFGINIYGVEAASEFYFGKPASEINAIEAATIAGITQNPSKWDPDRNPINGTERRDVVLDRMHEQGMITDDEYDEYVATPIEDYLDIHHPKLSCAAATDAPFFCDYVTKIVSTDPVFNTDDLALKGKDLLSKGGLNIITTLDVSKQRIANEELRDSIPSDDPSGFAMALVALEPTTGEILTMAQNRDFDPAAEEENSTAINYSVDREYGGSRGFSPGSTFKPVILANWLDTGHALNQTVSGDIRAWPSESWTAECLGGTPFAGQPDWKPANTGGTSARAQSVLLATANSVNTAYVAMANQLDLCGVRDTAEALGFHRADGADIEIVPSMALGTQNASPLTMANVAQTIANHGVRCEPIAILSITDADGNNIAVPPETCAEAISSQVADGVSYGMQQVMEQGSGKYVQLSDGRESAGKTGTAQDNTHLWFMGFADQLVATVWMGNPDKDVPAQYMTIGGQYHSFFYGSTIAGPTWKSFMDRALEGDPNEALATPSDEVLNGVPREVPSVLGRSESEARKILNDAGFQYPANPSVRYDPSVTAGRVVGQSPRSGSKALPGAFIGITISTDTRPSWWSSWPKGWDPLVAPDDYWGSSWPPAEFASNPPNGWKLPEPDPVVTPTPEPDFPTPGDGGNNGNGNGNNN